MTLSTPGIGGYVDNVGKAKSQGVEVSAQLRPTTGLTIGGWFSYNVAELTEDAPANATLIAQSGDWLPFVSRYSGNLSVDQAFPVTDTVSGSVGATVVYVGKRQDNFLGTSFFPQRAELAGYTQLDLRARLEYSAWEGNLFVTNVTDKRGILSYPQVYGTPAAVFYSQPRLIGMSVTRRF